MNIIEMTPEQLQGMSPNEIVEGIAQMLYDRAQAMSDLSDSAYTQNIKDMYEVKSRTYCAAAENVRDVLRLG